MMMLEPASVLTLFLRVAVVLGGLSLAQPEEFIGAVVMLLNVLCIDRLMSGAPREGELDSHTLAVVALLSRPLGLARSMGEPVSDRLPEVLLGITWCATGLGVAACAKGGGWAAVILNAECGLGLMLTYAPFEPMGAYAPRVIFFAGLSLLMYSTPPPPNTGDPPGRRVVDPSGRGYLACFLPVLFVDFWLACCFALASIACVIWREGRPPQRQVVDSLI